MLSLDKLKNRHILAQSVGIAEVTSTRIWSDWGDLIVRIWNTKLRLETHVHTTCFGHQMENPGAQITKKNYDLQIFSWKHQLVWEIWEKLLCCIAYYIYCIKALRSSVVHLSRYRTLTTKKQHCVMCMYSYFTLCLKVCISLGCQVFIEKGYKMSQEKYLNRWCC